MSDFLLQTPASPHWKIIGKRNHHGICTPLFSLRSEQSLGIGEYFDLLPLIEWCPSVGFDLIQLLPLNDTAGGASPYSAVSAFALNPIHLSLKKLQGFHESPLLDELFQLNRSKFVEYEKVWELKQAYLWEYFHRQYSQISKSFAYSNFVKTSHWLDGYARFFCEEKTGVLTPLYEYCCFLQFLCHCQLEEVRKSADAKNVLLKGDIPILLSRTSADTWELPQLFDFTLDAGAPPDHYALDGQNWHFPLYAWETNKEEVFAWWQKRLIAASRYYHVYRLDHAVGLFRIWGIPKNASALEGEFIPRSSEERWKEEGEERLQFFLKSCAMLPIAEDLGVVPSWVRTSLLHLGIPGTKVLRWEDNKPVASYPEVSMTTVSTHDSETLWQWFCENPGEVRTFLGAQGKPVFGDLNIDHYRDILYFSHKSCSLFHVNLLQEYFPLVKGLLWGAPKEERVNDASKPQSRYNFRYRFLPTVEEIVDNKELAKEMRGLAE